MFRSIWIFLLLIVSSFAFASSNHVYFLTEVTPPYYWINKDGKAQGVNVDLANALEPLLPFSSSLEHMPWARAVQETLDNPNLVLLSLLKTPNHAVSSIKMLHCILLRFGQILWVIPVS